LFSSSDAFRPASQVECMLRVLYATWHGGNVNMPAHRPNMIRGFAYYELRIEFCFSDGIRPCDAVSGHGMTVFFGLLRRYAPRNDCLCFYKEDRDCHKRLRRFRNDDKTFGCVV